MEGLTLLLGLLGVCQELLAEELRPVELYPLNTLFGQRDDRCRYLVVVAFSHHFSCQQLSGYAHPFVLNASNDISPLLFLQPVLLLHGFYERQVFALASYLVESLPVQGRQEIL